MQSDLLGRSNALARIPEENLSDFLRASREASGLTLRQVQEQTGGVVKNGYLSQMENGAIGLPSPAILWQLANVYGLDYGDLLVRAGHRVPKEQVLDREQAIEGLPLHALRNLDEHERRELIDFIAYLQQRKKRAASRRRGYPEGDQ